ncbi:MAG TPA: ATP-dependent DNA ligase [Acidimicrobiales bacterium]|nr:ATP-dependent DNA ligase [Acidimicrobiales bacterium]
MSVSELPVPPPVAPMLAKLSRELPRGNYIYEPKWDGFRCIVFRDGADVELGSRNELALTRYFPEVVEAVRGVLPARAVLDGEVVVAGPRGLDFDALSQRVHPADSRVRLLAEQTPASFVAFDILALGERDLRKVAFEERRRALESLLGAGPSAGSGPGWGAVHLTPATRDAGEAEEWFERFEGAGLDGVVAKPADLEYVAGKRVMVKVKHERTAEFVVAGFRWYRQGAAGGRARAGPARAPGASMAVGAVAGQEVGSLMLGLYDRSGALSHVGVIGAFPAQQRRELATYLVPFRASPGRGLEQHPWAEWAVLAQEAGRRLPGARSRWNAGKDLSFELLRPELVVEAAYEHLQGDRLRHTAQFRRWRPDRDPRSCTYDQLGAVVPFLLADVFGAGVVTAGSSTAERLGDGS